MSFFFVCRSSQFQSTVMLTCRTSSSVAGPHYCPNSTLEPRGLTHACTLHCMIQCRNNNPFHATKTKVLTLTLRTKDFVFVPRRPPERRHGYEQQFHTVTAQLEHDAMDAKRPRIEGANEAHLARAPPASVVLPLLNPMQDGLRTPGEIKKVPHTAILLIFVSERNPDDRVQLLRMWLVIITYSTLNSNRIDT